MKHKHFLFGSMLLIIAGSAGLYAQESVGASGGEASGSGGSVSYSVGQAFCSTNTGTGGSVAEGIQQPYEISVVIGMENVSHISLVCSAFPNPTADMLILKIEGAGVENMMYRLYDIGGRLLEDKIIESAETGIQMNEYVPSIYLLKVFKGTLELKTFRIIKN